MTAERFVRWAESRHDEAKWELFEPVYGGPEMADGDIIAPNPLIVAEVLSPSSVKRDMSEKLAGYFRAPTIAQYLIADPDDRRLIHYRLRRRLEASDADRPGRSAARSARSVFRRKRNLRLKRGACSLPKPTVTVTNFREDPLFPRIERATAAILANGKVVAPIDVLVRMDLLKPELVEDWRRGRIPYLEKVIATNLTRASRLLRILRFHAHDLNLKPSFTFYKRFGKGPKQQLRFTKTGDHKLEEAYATHFVWPGKGPFHPPVAKETPQDAPSNVEPARRPPGGG
jgi:hypothetical protein